MTIASTGGTVTLGLYDTQSQLKEKASITYVDNKVDPLQAGHKGYATLTQAQAAQSGLAANTVVEVLSDTTEANNGYYLWNGTTLTKTTFSPLVQANNYTDGKVATAKAEAIATAASDATTKANNAVTTANTYTDSVFADVPTTLEPYVTQAEAAATAANIAGKVYATPSEGVAPVTGVPSGQYFNVRSSSNDNYIDEYLNNAGVAQATGKSYPSSAYVQGIENYVAKPFVTGKIYALNSRVQLSNGDIVRSTVAANIVNPNVDMTGWVKTNAASQIFDANSGSQQTLNEMMFNSNIMYRGATPNQNTISIHTIVETLANSLNDGDKLIVPTGTWYWDGQAIITKQINIECLGTINAKFRDSSPHILFRSAVDYTYNAADLLSSFQKGQNKLALISAFSSANLSDFFCVVTSTEVAIHRAGFAEDYTKNIVLDVIEDDGTLRDQLPFGITDLSKATLRFVKKKTAVTHNGLVLKNTNTNATTLRGMNIKYEYSSNIHTENGFIDQGLNGDFGSSFLINNCFNLSFESTWSKATRNNSNSLYNFQIANAGYCSFNKCGNISSGANGILRGIEGRHGYKTLVDNCLVNGVDDHWGYDITVKNSNLPLGVGIAGGSVTIENVAASVIFNQRQDTPYNDGTLTIKNCKPYSAIARLLGHEDPIWTSKDYTKRKCFDVINIDGITAIASDMIQTRSSADAMLFLVRDPQLDETQVFRDTVLNISNVTVINDVAALSQINVTVGWNENNATPLKNYDKKQMFASINLENVKVFFKNGAVPADSGIPPVSDTLTLKDCQNLEFYRYRARYVNICGGSVLNVGTYNRFYDCELLNINGVNLSECTSKLIYANKTDRYYQNTLVNIYNSNLPSQSYGYDGFTSYAATAQGITLKSAFGNTYKVYDLKDNSIIDNFYLTDLRAYNADRNLRYKFASELIVAANTESAILSADFPSVRSFDYVVGNFDVNNNLQIITVPPASYGVAPNKVYFKVKNTSAASITIPINTGVSFRIV